jgi:hypothetical protein
MQPDSAGRSQATSHHRSNTMKANPVAWFEIYVQDMARARTFYETVLQVTLQRLPPPPAPEGEAQAGEMEMWSFPMAQEGYGASGALVHMEGVPSGGSGTMVYFSCEDCAVEAARAAEAGGGISRAKMPIGEYGFIALVKDTEGNLIGLHSMR